METRPDAGDPAPATPSAPAGERSAIRSVALPSEHGGWGLTLEPGLLGLIVAPGVAGLSIALAALVAFLARTPLKLALVDRRRGRHLPRTVLAWKVAAAELAVVAVLVAVAAALGDGRFWIPALVAAPFIAVESWYEIRSRGRRLVPEVAGAIGVSSIAAMVLLAGGRSAALAAGAWMVLAARVLTSIPFVRTQIFRIRGRSTSPAGAIAADAGALAVAAGAVVVDERLLTGAIAVAAVVVAQRLMALGTPPRPVVLGMRQMALGVGIAVATAVGVLVAGA